MNMNRGFPLFGVFLIIILIINTCCKQSKDLPNNPSSDPTQSVKDTNWVTQQQIDIPWPGLANSAWPMFMHDPQHTGRSPYRGPQLGQVEWVLDPGPFTIYSSPVIDEDGTIYFSGTNGNFFAVSSSGTEKWRGFGHTDNHALIAVDGSIYHASSILFSYDRSGNVNWKDTLGQNQTWTSGAISKDGQTYYVGNQLGIWAIRKDGSIKWRVNPDSQQWCYFSVSISHDGATLYVPGTSGLFAVDTSGSVASKVFQQGVTDVLIDNDGNLYFGIGGRNGSVFSVCSITATGNLRWKLDGTGFFGQALAMSKDGTLYASGDGLYAIDYSGKLKWKYVFPSSSTQCPPVVDADGNIYVGRSTSRTTADSINFYAINPNGTLKWQLSLRAADGRVPDIDSPPTITADGRLYVGSDYPSAGRIFRIR